MSTENLPFIERDISWLAFNERVLQEAKDRSVPLYERIKFLAIYSSNLDEFFRVRVASIRSFRKLDKPVRREPFLNAMVGTNSSPFGELLKVATC